MEDQDFHVIYSFIIGVAAGVRSAATSFGFLNLTAYDL